MARANRKRLLIANWKMYVESPKKAADFARGLKKRATRLPQVEFTVAPPLLFLPAFAQIVKGTKIGVAAQNMSAFGEGAHTGDISALMLKNSGIGSVIVGHSERRAAGESSEEVAEKLARVGEAKLRAVLCIGEKSRDESGGHFAFLGDELKHSLGNFAKTGASRSLVVAYEPIWAIGKTAKDAMKPEELRETVIFIRKQLTEILGREAAMRVPILYGGSVEPDNARALLEGGDVSGFLVGHASADLGSFLGIAEAFT